MYRKDNRFRLGLTTIIIAFLSTKLLIYLMGIETAQLFFEILIFIILISFYQKESL